MTFVAQFWVALEMQEYGSYLVDPASSHMLV